MRASLRSLRLREADRAPANAGARLRLGGMCGAIASCRSGSSCRSELVRRGCAGRNPSRTPPRRFGFALASLRRRPPATAFRPRSGAAPPSRQRSGLALRTTAFALGRAPMPRPPSRRRFGLALEPRPGAPPPLGTTAFTLTPRSGAVPPLGTTTLALGPRPSLWRRAPGSGRFSRRDAATRAALGAMTFALALCPPPWGP